MTALREQADGPRHWPQASGYAFNPDAGPEVARPEAARPESGPELNADAQTVAAMQDHLARTIERDVIPRLLLAHQTTDDADATSSTVTADDADVKALTEGVLAADADISLAVVEAVHARGVPPEAVMLDLLTPVARRLGEMWEDDRCDFTQVTIGMMRLQQALRRLSPHFQSDQSRRDLGHRVLLLPAPGEQHSFGLVMVSEFFSRAGWSVSGGLPLGATELASLVGGTWFAVVGFSVATQKGFEAIPELVRVIRRSSSNPDVGVMVGGPYFVAHPELAASIGADATALDARQAVKQAHRLLALRPACVEVVKR